MLEVERIRNGKRILQQEPLFPGYLFLHTELDSPLLGKVRSTFGVRGLLRFGDTPVTVADALIQDIRQRCARPATLPKLCPGDSVKLLQGPLKDYQAIFQRYDGQERAVILLQLLGQQNELLVRLEQLVQAEL